MSPQERDTSIIWLDSAESTNRELRMRIQSLANLSVIATKEQTAGRGQGTHTWHSSPGKNLTFSIYYDFNASSAFQLPVADALLITCVTTLAIRDYLLDNGIEARIKWPNDIWVGDKKICGILIENILDGRNVSKSIVGIGLDVNEIDWPSELPNPVSMRELSGKEFELHEELEKLHEQICRRFAQLAEPCGRVVLLAEFNEHMFRLETTLP